MRRIVCFGEALIDFLAQPGATPGAPRAFVQHAGGAPANVAVAAACLGAPACFAGMVGRDMFGDFLVDSLHAAGVDTSCVVRTEQAKTALAFVALDAQGERSFSFYRPPAADLLFRPEHFDARCFDGAAVFHVCSNSLTDDGIAETTLEGMRRARAAGALVSLDLNLRPMLWPVGVDPLPRLWQALRAADLIKLARDELEYLAAGAGGGAVGEDTVRREVLAGAARLLIVTDGAAPVRWYTRQASGEVHGFRVKAVDTTAAGDAFVGGLLCRLAEQGIDAGRWDAFVGDPGMIQDVVRFAAAVGALAVTRHGAFAAMPSLAQVRQLLEEPPKDP